MTAIRVLGAILAAISLLILLAIGRYLRRARRQLAASGIAESLRLPLGPRLVILGWWAALAAGVALSFL